MRARWTIGAALPALLLASAACGAALLQDGGCDRTAERSAAVDAADARELKAIARAGSLAIHGVDGLTEVRVEGRACASTDGLLQKVRIEARREGDGVRVEAKLPDTGLGQTARLDLTLKVPAGLDVDARDGSGDVEIRNVGAVRLDDGSGDARLQGVAGDARVDDGSGDLVLRDVSGRARVDDGSGDVTLRNVRGGVRVDDGSGKTDVSEIAGDVEIEDGSGDVLASNVDGQLQVHDGSGDIRLSQISGTVRVHDSSGDIRAVDLGEDLRILDDSSGDLRFERVAGRVYVK